jgi:hypothetical protein
MHGSKQGITASTHPQRSNVFTASFIDRMAEQDEPPTAGDADVAGPWRIEPIGWNGGQGFGLFRMGESLDRGFAPTAVFPSRWLALVGAAVLPGTGQDPLLLLSKQPDVDGVYPLTLAGGRDGDGGDGPVGQLLLFDEKAIDAMNVVLHLLRAPESLAYVLEAAGAVTLERCGTILDERTAEKRE